MTRSRLKSRRQFLAITGVGTLATLLLSACGPEAAPSPAPTAASTSAPAAPTTAAKTQPTPASAPPSGTQTYQISFANDWNSGVRNETIKFGLQEFNRAYPNVTVEPLQIGVAGTSHAGGLSETIVTQFIAGQAPDVIFGWPEMVGVWNKYLADLTDAWKERGADELGIIDHPPITHYQGKRLAVDFAPASAGWLINLTMFEKAGLAEPSEEWTWSEQLELMKQLTTPDGKQWGMWFRNSWDIDYFPFVLSNLKNPASYFADPEETKVGYDTPEAYEGFKWFVDFIYQHKVCPSPAAAASMATGDTNDLFMLGIAAMAPSWLQGTGTIDRFVKDRFQWKLMPQPRSPSNPDLHWHMGQTEPLAVSLDSQKRGNLDPSLDLVLFFAGSDVVQNFIAEPANRPTIPVKKSVLSSPTYMKGPPENMALITTQLTDAANAVNGRYPKKYWAEWMETVKAEADRALIGEATAEEAWKSLVEKTQQVIDAAKE